MRLAIFIFICFAASTAVNSTQTNYSGANNQVEQLRDIPNDIPRLPPNSSLARKKWKTKDIQNVRGSGTTTITTDMEVIGSSNTELNWIAHFMGYKKIVIKNNPKLERIVISGKINSLLMTLLEVQGNPVLKSIRIEAESYDVDRFIITENNELETIEYNVLQTTSKETWTISNNAKLRRIQLSNCREINQPLQIVGNKALTELEFPETMEQLWTSAVHINDNDNLESIKIPGNIPKLWVHVLEIRQNDRLKTIDLGEQTRWKATNVVVRENPLLSPETLETLKGIQWRSKDIQGDEAPPVNPAPVNPAPRNPINPSGNRNRDRNRPYVPAPADSSGLSTIAIVGLVFLGLMILGCVGCCVCCCWRRSAGGKKKKEKGNTKNLEESSKGSPSGQESPFVEPV